MLPAELPWELEPAAVSAVDGALAGADDDAVGAEPVLQLLLPLLFGNSYERLLQPTTVSQDGDRIHGLGLPPLIAATALTSSPAGAAALILVNRRFPFSTRTARSGPTHQASWLSAKRSSINELMESQYGASSAKFGI